MAVSSELMREAKSSTSELRSWRSASTAARRVSGLVLSFLTKATMSGSSSVRENAPASSRAVVAPSDWRSWRAALVRRGAIFFGSRRVLCWRSCFATWARDFGLARRAVRASPQPGASGNCARRRSSSVLGARSSSGRTAATCGALIFGGSARAARIWPSMGSSAAASVSRKALTSVGCFSRKRRTR